MSLQTEIESLTTCLDRALSKPEGPDIRDVAVAMQQFVSHCYTRHVEVTLCNQKVISRLESALYGPQGEPEKGLLDLRRQLCRLAKIALGIGAIALTAVGFVLQELAQRLLALL